MMTDEELQRVLLEVSEGITRLSNPDKPLTKEEKRYRGNLLTRKKVLSQLKEAKAKNQPDAEVYHTTVYSMLVTWGEKHPFLAFIMMNMMRIKWRGRIANKDYGL